MSQKPKVLLLSELHFAHEAWSALSSSLDVVRPTSKERASFIQECNSGVFDGTVAIYRTFDSFPISGKIDDEILSCFPPTLKFICHTGAGYDQIDIAACTAHDVRVSNTPGAVDDATADVTLFLIIGALRNLSLAMKSLRRGHWHGNPGLELGHDPRGKILGILGMGGIGGNVAEKARAFGMKVRYYNRTRLSESQEAKFQAEYVSFETLLQESDVLSLNLPLNANTRHIISTKEFAMMKKGVVVVNTARGAVMDEAALVDALDSGHVASAGLDVFENEPEIHPGLLANDKVLLLPHMGTHTYETETKMETWALDNLKLAVFSGKLKSIVPEQKNLK